MMDMSNDNLYEVRADNGLGGRVIGRDAADELAAELVGRPDVLSVEASPCDVDFDDPASIVDWMAAAATAGF